MSFFIENWTLIAVALASGGMLLWPTLSGSAGAGSLNASEVVQLINREKATVVDVCGPDEFATGHVGGAKNVPLAELERETVRWCREMLQNSPMALRCLIIDLLHRTSIPLVVLGDFNDTPDSVTTQLICATTEIAYDRSARDVALFNAYDLQGEAALKKDVAYSHIHQGSPSVLDQILVSEEFMATGRNSVGDVRRVDYFNDHLHEGRDRTRSDHGFVRALLRLEMPPATPQSPP